MPNLIEVLNEVAAAVPGFLSCSVTCRADGTSIGSVCTNRDLDMDAIDAYFTRMLSKNDKVSVEDAITIINDEKPYGVERWLEVLHRAYEHVGLDNSTVNLYLPTLQDILEWNGQLDRESTGALKYYYWREQMIVSDSTLAAKLSNLIDDWYHIVDGRHPKNLSSELQEHSAFFLENFIQAMQRMRLEHKSVDAKFGDHFRVGRGDKSWPVGGGSLYESRTLRSMSYTDRNADFTQWGRGGQTSTQIVELSKPIKSYIYIPLGQSDDPSSAHFSDQAEKLFSVRALKPSWWTPEELQGNIESRTVLEVKL